MGLALKNSPADVVCQLLIDTGIGSDPETGSGAWPVHAAGEPDLPDNALTVYDTAPKSDGRSQPTGEVLQHFGVQVRVRAVDHLTGSAKARAIEVILSEQVYDASVTIGASNYVIQSFANFNVLYLGKEVPPSKRSLFTINMLASIREI